VVLLGAGGLAVAALVAVLRNRVALRVIFAGAYAPLTAGLLLSVAASAAGLALLARRRGAPPPAWRPSLPLRGALYLLVGAAAVDLAWLQPYRSLVTLVCFALAGGAAALLALESGRVARRLPRRLVLVLDFGLFAACLLAVGGELALRAIAAHSTSPLFAQTTESVLDLVARARLRPEQSTPDSPVNSGGTPTRSGARASPACRAPRRSATRSASASCRTACTSRRSPSSVSGAARSATSAASASLPTATCTCSSRRRCRCSPTSSS
jgi:hypothetical protein